MAHTDDVPDRFGDCRFATRAIRSGQARTGEQEHNDPIFPTSSFVFANAAQAAARFAEEEPGNVYSRFTNPTVRAFEQRLASLENGVHCVATSSGMGAILSTCLALLKSGDHVVAAHNLFGTTVNLFSKVMARFGVDTTFVPVPDLDEWRAACHARTRLLFLESPTNPLGEIGDIAALGELAHRHDALLAVDNVMCTPVLQQPLDLGADIVIHSATKYIDGQGRCVGGAVVTNDEQIRDDVFVFLRTAGPTMSPFNAWVFLNGLETLKLRMHAHCDNAMRLAQWLEDQPAVSRVHFLGLESHPQRALALTQQTGFGAIVSFEVEGGRDAAWTVIDATRMLSITANLGDAKTTIVHPASTTHGRLSQAERDRAGIRDSLIRVAVGLEDTEDVIADLRTGLDRVAA